MVDSGLPLPYLQDIGAERRFVYNWHIDQLCGRRRISHKHASSTVYPSRRSYAVVARELRLFGIAS